MEVKELLKIIWNQEKEPESFVIKIHPREFHELASDKESTKYLELYERENRIIGHKFQGVLLMITQEVEKHEIVSL